MASKHPPHGRSGKSRPTPPKGVKQRSESSKGNPGARFSSSAEASETGPERSDVESEPDAPPSSSRLETETPAGIPFPAGRTVNAATEAAVRATRRATQVTPIIVRKAASILEEEVAMGIGAAKRIEQRFLDVNALRAQSSDAVMSRFRHDAHEAVDIILDIVTAAVITVEERAGRFVNVTASRTFKSMTGPSQGWSRDETGTRLSTVRIPRRVAAGAVGELKISLENPSDEGTAQFTLHAAELVSASGSRIPGERVVFEPATLRVGPRATGDVAVTVSVPEGTPSGVYEGLVRATQLDTLRALLSIEVG
jgi:hypothetical protein